MTHPAGTEATATGRREGAGALVVLHVTAPGETGGLEQVVGDLSTAFVARGHRVALLAAVHPGSVPEAYLAGLREAGIDVHVARIGGRGYAAEYRAIRAAAEAVQPDVLHTHGFRSDVLGLLAARRSGLPVVTTVHGFTGRSRRVRFYERIQRLAMRRFDRVVSVSRSVTAILRRAGVSADRIAEIRNARTPAGEPLDRQEARRALGLPEAGPVIGWVGRISVEKGPDVFVDAVSRCSEPVPALVIGDGPARAAVEAQIRERGAGDRIRLAGAVPDAARYLRAFDAIIMSSRAEGTPIVLLEAMAAGVPIVSTRVGGIPDMLDDREAMLVPPGDPGALAAAIDRLLGDPAAAVERADLATARLARDFDPVAWADAYEKLYRSVTGTRAG